MKLGRCRSCLDSIRWVRLEGKWHPANPDPVDGGNLRIVESSAGFDVARVLTKAQRQAAQGEGLHMSHFATCPHAADHRKAAR